MGLSLRFEITEQGDDCAGPVSTMVRWVTSLHDDDISGVVGDVSSHAFVVVSREALPTERHITPAARVVVAVEGISKLRADYSSTVIIARVGIDPYFCRAMSFSLLLPPLAAVQFDANQPVHVGDFFDGPLRVTIFPELREATIETIFKILPVVDKRSETVLPQSEHSQARQTEYAAAWNRASHRLHVLCDPLLATRSVAAWVIIRFQEPQQLLVGESDDRWALFLRPIDHVLASGELNPAADTPPSHRPHAARFVTELFGKVERFLREDARVGAVTITHAAASEHRNGDFLLLQPASRVESVLIMDESSPHADSVPIRDTESALRKPVAKAKSADTAGRPNKRRRT